MRTTLAQILTDSPVPRLPAPPTIEHYLFESPWVVVGALAVAGMVGFFVLNRQGKAKQGVYALLGGLGLAAAVSLAGYLVDTQREQLLRQTRELIARTATADTAALGPMLSERVSLVCALPLPIPLPEDKRTLLEAVRRTLGETYPIAEHSTGGGQASVDGPNSARTQMRVWARVSRQQAMYDAPIGSWWRIDWRKEGDTWRVSTITLMQMDGLGGGSR